MYIYRVKRLSVVLLSSQFYRSLSMDAMKGVRTPNTGNPLAFTPNDKDEWNPNQAIVRSLNASRHRRKSGQIIKTVSPSSSSAH